MDIANLLHNRRKSECEKRDTCSRPGVIVPLTPKPDIYVPKVSPKVPPKVPIWRVPRSSSLNDKIVYGENIIPPRYLFLGVLAVVVTAAAFARMTHDK